MKKDKKLRFWNGRGHGIYNEGHINVAAYSIKQACELVGQACELYRPLSYSELKNYYSECWGENMADVSPESPCVYIEKCYYQNSKPIKVI